MDERGIVHNTPISSDKDAPPAEIQEKEEFLTEEQLQKKLEKEREEKPAFYTWIDEQGQLRSAPKPEVAIEFETQEIVADSVFAPPFRLPHAITNGLCCSDYAKEFGEAHDELSVTVATEDSEQMLFRTQDGYVPAAYLTLTERKSDNQNWLKLNVYKIPADQGVEVIGLNAEYQPIYLSSDTKGLHVDETWSTYAHRKMVLEIPDPEVRYLIVFIKSPEIKEYSISLKSGLD